MSNPISRSRRAEGWRTAGPPPPSPVVAVFKDLQRSALHQQDPHQVAQPVAHHKGGGEGIGSPVLHHKGESVGQGQIDHQIVPPAERGQEPTHNQQGQGPQADQRMGPAEAPAEDLQTLAER